MPVLWLLLWLLLPRVRFGAMVDGVFTTMAGAFNAAKDRAGISTSQLPSTQWTIRGPHSEYRSGATVRNADKSHQGRIYEFEVYGRRGQKEYRYLVVHDKDKNHDGIGHMHSETSEHGARTRMKPGENYKNTDGDLPPIPFAARKMKKR